MIEGKVFFLVVYSKIYLEVHLIYNLMIYFYFTIFEEILLPIYLNIAHLFIKFLLKI